MDSSLEVVLPGVHARLNCLNTTMMNIPQSVNNNTGVLLEAHWQQQRTWMASVFGALNSLLLQNTTNGGGVLEVEMGDAEVQQQIVVAGSVGIPCLQRVKGHRITNPTQSVSEAFKEYYGPSFFYHE